MALLYDSSAKLLSAVRFAMPDRSDFLLELERQVITLVGAGLTNREIGWRLGFTKREIRAVLKGIYERLQTHDRAILLMWTDHVESRLRTSSQQPTHLRQWAPRGESQPIKALPQNGKVRINELARELEVKAREILERLPELGVPEKKTHSSSIDEEVANRLRTPALVHIA